MFNATEGVEHEMPYAMFALDEGYLRADGIFRLTVNVKGVLGIVRLNISPPGPISGTKRRSSSPSGVSDQRLYEDTGHFDLQGRNVDRRSLGNGVYLLGADSNGDVRRILLSPHAPGRSR